MTEGELSRWDEPEAQYKQYISFHMQQQQQKFLYHQCAIQSHQVGSVFSKCLFKQSLIAAVSSRQTALKTESTPGKVCPGEQVVWMSNTVQLQTCSVI